MKQQDVKPGDEVRALSTGRRMIVRRVDGDQVECAWFDGRETRVAVLPLSRVQACAATRDGEVLSTW